MKVKCNGNSADDVVISGISGRFPESDNLEEFKKNLFDGIDLVTDDDRRWPSGIYGLTKRMGKIKHINHFDAKFFGVTARQAHVIDPQIRILLELTHEALIDAGINPAEMKGSNTGVFIGTSFSASECEQYWTTVSNSTDGYGILGSCRNMFANRISFAFEFTGPSYVIDSACSSSLHALQQAVAAIKSGQCVDAIVGGSHFMLKPGSSVQLHRLQMVNMEGACRSFDNSANGYVRSEAASIMYLQRSRDAKRIYATVVGARTNRGGNKSLGITYPVGSLQKKLIDDLYEEVQIDPSEVSYVEAHATGTKVGDPQEVNSIAEAFCKNRKEPLLIGSVKSNMGHSEPSSGMCSIAKVIIAMETGFIPQNIHFKVPNHNIPALLDGRVKVVDRNIAWEGGYVGINSFGFGGSNAHVILKSNSRQKVNKLSTELPRIFTVSGTTQEAVDYFLDKINETPKNDDLMALIHDIHKQNIPGHSYRGFSLIGDKLVKKIGQVLPEIRPIWYVYSGMGSQWSTMGKELMKLSTFRLTINKCAQILEPHGINLVEIITKSGESALANFLNASVAISAIQIALTDTLSSLGIHPDGLIGHSNGETACAYADGCFTMEQAILASFVRGKAISEINDNGAMASVGLSWEECLKRCPPDIYPACHNSQDNVTVSGPPDSINRFVKELKSGNIFAKVVESAGIAFHSKYITEAGPTLQKYLEEIIPKPKPRSKKWISSSISESQWESSIAQLSSADYHVNNLLSPVLFYEAVKHIPENAIVIEVAPHCLMQAILKRSLGQNCTNIGLMKKGHEDNLNFFMESLGKLYTAGANPQVANLYPPVFYPVGCGTPMLHSMIKWDHSTEWYVPNFLEKSSKSGEIVVEVDLSKEEDKFLMGHSIDGRFLLPVCAYLKFVWEIFAKTVDKDFEQLPIVFENVQFYHPTILPEEGSVKMTINILESAGNFEICEGGSVAATGRIFVPNDITKEILDLPKPCLPESNGVMQLSSDDVYTDLRLRGYEYDGIFRGIFETDNRGNAGLLKWNNNWITFFDTMVQFYILGEHVRGLYLPNKIDRIAVDPIKHLEIIAGNGKQHVPVCSYRNSGIAKSGGIEMRGLKFTPAARRQQTPGNLQISKYIHIPYENSKSLCEDHNEARYQSLTVILQTMVENCSLKPKIVELVEENSSENLFAKDIVKIIESIGTVEGIEYIIVTPENIGPYQNVAKDIGARVVEKNISNKLTEKNVHLIVTKNLIGGKKIDILENFFNSLERDGFILTEETCGDVDDTILSKFDLEVIAKQIAGPKMYLLLRKSSLFIPEHIVVHITEKNYKWVETFKKALKKSESDGTKIYLVAQNEETSGLMGFMTCVMLEPGSENIRSIFIQDKASEKFSTISPFFVKQLKKNLVFNILKNGAWGTFRHILLGNATKNKIVPVEHAFISSQSRNTSNFKWIQGLSPNHKCKNQDMKLCSVYYAPLNSNDMLLASGNLYKQDNELGMEFSGKDSKGRRIMGIVSGGCLATTVLADTDFLWEVPDKWSLEEASTIPVAYATSYYALVVRGQMKQNESVLIHDGTRDISQAAISIALYMGCTIFTTVRTKSQRESIKNMFPQLTDNHIGNSYDTSFEQMILEQTNGQGVDLVLNSLEEEILQASVRCLAQHGRFLEVGRVRYCDNKLLSTEFFLKNITYNGVFLEALLKSKNNVKKEVWRLISDGIENNSVKPIAATIFSDTQVEKAFNYFAKNEGVRKTVVKIRDEELPTTKMVQATARIYMNRDKTYVLIGGLGGYGLELTDWLIARGATKIVLCSRSGIKTGYQSLCVRRWRELGVTVIINTTDVTNEIGAKKLLEESNKIGPVGGIFNLAVVLKDAMMNNQTEESFKAACVPKVDVTRSLDTASRILCPQLDYFVVYSSVSCALGNRGQANYGYANSVMERICESRQAAGFPGLAIQHGVIGDVGVGVKILGLKKDVKVAGTISQSIASCLQTTDYLLQQSHPVVSSFPLAAKQHTRSERSSSSPVNAVANILGIKDLNITSPNTTLTEMGMDSIMATEVKQILERSFNLSLSVQDIRNLSFTKLAELGSKDVTKLTENNIVKDNEADNNLIDLVQNNDKI